MQKHIDSDLSQATELAQDENARSRIEQDRQPEEWPEFNRPSRINYERGEAEKARGRPQSQLSAKKVNRDDEGKISKNKREGFEKRRLAPV